MRLSKFFLLISIALFLSASLFAQKKTSLIVAEYDDNAATNHLQYIVKYSFTDGVPAGKEQLLSVPMTKSGVSGNYIRFDIGKNKLYRDQFLVTGIGNVIDLKNKKVVVDAKDEFVAFSGDSIIFYTNDIFKGKYFSVYDIKSGKYEKVQNPNYNAFGRPEVEVDESTAPFKIDMYSVNGKKENLVKDAGYGEAQPLVGDNVKRKFPIFWLNYKYFLFASFSKNQQMTSIYKVGTDKTMEKIADIDAIPATGASTFFELDPAGNVVYSCGKGRFLIDMNKKKADAIAFENSGNGFAVESAENSKVGRTVKSQDKEIGKKFCEFANAKTNKDYIAVESYMLVGTEHYPQGVAVWNTVSKKWAVLDISSLANIIGWIQE